MALEAEMYGTMREAVDAVKNPEGYFQALYEAGQIDSEYVEYLKKHYGIELRKEKY